jgi:2-C-methyl-D-erythritol 4-phosphate cytidylyltransferase
MKKTKICAVIVAGGKGRRMEGKTPKQFLKISNLPIIIRTLTVFQNSKEIESIVTVLSQKWQEKGRELIKKHNIDKVIKIANAGNTRQSSVYNGLIALQNQNPEFVVIHDAVRPFVTKELINASCVAVKKHGAVSAAIPLSDTIFEKSKEIILNRKNLVRLQTPQTFKYSLILEAHKRARKRKKRDFSDDSSLLLHYGIKTTLIEGDKKNIKITDRKDLRLAQAITLTDFGDGV